MASAVAAIDCGTNSTRLLVVNREGTPLERLMRITRLGEGVDATGVISDAALQRCLGVLGEYREVMDRHGVGAARLAATSAARDAANGPAFLAEAAAITGAEAAVIPGAEEARLSYLGATAGLDPVAGDDVIIDIGGGSTELALARDGVVRGWSMQVGCVRATERWLHGDPPTVGELEAASQGIAAMVAEAMDELPELGQLRAGSRLIGLAGSVSTLAQLDGGIAEYRFEEVHLRRLTAEAVGRWTSRLAALPAAERRSLPGMVPGREDVIVGGALVLREAMGALGFSECLVSEHDILDGIAADLLARLG